MRAQMIVINDRATKNWSKKQSLIAKSRKNLPKACASLGFGQIRRNLMSRRQNNANTTGNLSAQPRFHQRASEIQPYGTVSHMLPLELEEPVRLEMTEQLNKMLADTMTLRDLYKKSHWQVAGPTFYQLHLLYDKHYGEQVEL